MIEQPCDPTITRTPEVGETQVSCDEEGFAFVLFSFSPIFLSLSLIAALGDLLGVK
jgi:hypothetical protein